MKRLAILVVASFPAVAQAEMTVQNQRYTCARGVEVPVVYATDGDQAVAVLVVEGRQMLLYSEVSASGVRYGWPSDGSNYVWWTKGDTATLLWKDETGAETPVLTDCTTQS
jgi:membrane-bound inhibitor of C-type lysozyme